MPLLLATSCLQGRPLADAAIALAGLGADGLQFTPGNLPSPSFSRLAAAFTFPVRYHHGWSWHTRVAPVYEGERPILGGPDWSIHPPEAVADPRAWLEEAAARGIPVEIMPQGFLGNTADLSVAMDIGGPLAVDIAHLHIQRTQGHTDAATARRLLDHAALVEIHLSGNDGRHDLHTPLQPDTPYLDWARERGETGIPLVLECYMHRLDLPARRAQVELARG